MKTRMLLLQVALAAAALLYASAAAASPLTIVDCDLTPGAEANGKDPTSCAWGNLPNDSPATETAAINAVFSSLGDGGDFFFIGKYDKETGIDEMRPGFTLTAEPITDPLSDWDYLFRLVSDYAGQTVDFVLMVKQPGGPDGEHNVAYAWTGLTLDIEGLYNSFRSDYSHVSGFIRGVERVHEPGALMLLGTGLLGFALLRRRLS